MLAIPVVIIVCVFVLSLSWLAIVVLRQRGIAQQVRQAIHSAAASDINDVYAAVARTGEGQAHAYILGRTNMKSSLAGNCIGLPQTLDRFPWSGKALYINTANRINAVIENDTDQQTRVGGNIYASIPVPMADNETGQGYPVFSPYKWLDGNHNLLASLRRISPRYPQQVLLYLVTPGEDNYAYEPDHQVRIGGGIAWVQKPEVPICDVCEERMRFILQCPGTLLDGGAEPEAIYYWFGCKTHSDNIQCITQYR